MSPSDTELWLCVCVSSLSRLIPIGPPKGIEVRDFNYKYRFLYQLLVTGIGIIVFYLEIPSELIRIMKILENDTF